MDMPKFGPVLESDAFKQMSEETIVNQPPPLVMLDPPAGPPPAGAEAPPPANMFTFMEVEDRGKWTEGFLAHANSKTGTWGYEVPITRSEFCDEAKTRVFKSV